MFRRARTRPAGRLLTSLLTLLSTTLSLALLLPGGAAALPLDPAGWHAWPQLGHSSEREASTLFLGPEDATILEPWPFPADAPIRSAPVIDKRGNAYFGADDGALYSLHRSAPDAPSLERWRFAAGGGPILGSPALKEELEGSPTRVYFANQGGEVYALDAFDGSVVWQHSLGLPIYSSPALSMDSTTGHVSLYVIAGNEVVVLEESGLWATPTVAARTLYNLSQAPSVAASPALSADGSTLYVSDGVRFLYTLDAASGQEVCFKHQLGNATSATPPLVDRDGNVYAATDEGKVYRFAGSPGFGGVCATDWTYQAPAPIVQPLALGAGGDLAAVSGTTALVIDAAGGTPVCPDCWSAAVPWIDPATAPAFDGAGTLFLAGRDKSVHALRGDGAGGAVELWKVETLTQGTLTPFAIDAVGRLYAGSSDRNLYVFQDVPAFKVAFDSTYLNGGPDADVDSLRQVYGTTDPLRTLSVVRDPAEDGQAAYSSDGRLLAFTSDRDGKRDVFLATSGGRGARNLSVYVPPCAPTQVSGDRSGLGGTTHAMAYDADLATYFESSYDDWQYLQVDLGCAGELAGLRRYMSRDGTDTLGDRGWNGEGASYSLDGVSWTQLTGADTTGWGGYVNYAPHAWHSVSYGWSAELRLTTPAQARYVRFRWDGNRDALHEVELSFTPPAANPPPFPQGAAVSEPAFSPTRLDGSSRLNDGGRYLATTVDNDLQQLFFVDLDELVATDEVRTLSLGGWLDRQYSGGSAMVASSLQRQAAFSPDGRKLAYSACRFAGGSRVDELVLINLGHVFNPPQLSPRRVVTSHFSGGSCDQSPPSYAPAFSPDGRYLLYVVQGKVWVHELATASDLFALPASPSLDRPAWSPDGTQIATSGAGTFFGTGGELHAAQGPQYQSLGSLTAPLGASASTRLDEAELHPTLMPSPLLSLDCTAEVPSPVLLQPQRQQPRGMVEIRGCGFDVKYPERNRVFFRHARDRTRWVEAAVTAARVDVDLGLGVLEVMVPELAGDGPVRVTTPFGQTLVPGFEVVPLPLELEKRRSIEGAKIRVLGYGFQVTTTTNPRLNRVFFTGPSGQPELEATVDVGVLAPCDDGITPCPAGAPLEDGARKVEWLEVTVPAGALRGPVRVTNADPAEGNDTQRFFDLMVPHLELSREEGCEGDLNTPGTGVVFTGEEYPYDPYFGYVDAELRQEEGQTSRHLGFAALQPALGGAGTFTSIPLEVAANGGGELTMAGLGVASGARAEQPFKTPLQGLPIIFVPGTSGTFITNTGGSFSHGHCVHPALQAADPGHPLTNDVAAGEDVWVNSHGLLHVVLGGCDGWLDPTGLDPLMGVGDDGLPHPDFPTMGPGAVIRTVSTPDGRTIDAYGTLISFITGPPPAGMGRPLGNPAAVRPPGAPPLTPNGLYLFNFDWRKSFSSQAARLDTLVDTVLAQTDAEKVLILTQSAGGPMTQFYLRSPAFDATEKVDQVISLGGGFMGVVLPYKILQLGDEWGLRTELAGFEFSVDPEKIQELGMDWPTAYWQLPQTGWFDDPNGACPAGNCAFIEEDGVDADGDGTVAGMIGDITSSYGFILGNRGSRPSINGAKFNFAFSSLLGNPPGGRALGDWRDGTGGVFFHRVVGSGVPTINRLRYYERTKCIWIPISFWSPLGPVNLIVPFCFKVDEIEPVMLDGDGTIPLRGAVGILDEFDDRIWGLNGVAHLPMTQNTEVLELIRRLASGKVCSTTQGVSSAFVATPGNPQPTPAASASRAVPMAKGGAEPAGWWKVELRGRRGLHVWDAEGRHAGPREDLPDRLEREIPGLIYERGPTYTQVYLPEETSFTLEVAAAEGEVSFDTVDLKVALTAGFENTSLASFLDVPLAPASTARLEWDGLAPPEEPALQVDANGDGDGFEHPADAVLHGEASRDRERPAAWIEVRDGVVEVGADDTGGAGVHRVIYGFDRNHLVGTPYEGPVEMPAEADYVWAYAIDGAGNSQHPPSILDLCEGCAEPAVSFGPTEKLVTTEGGGRSHLNVVLHSKPEAEVRIAVKSSDPAEGEVSKTELVFTPENALLPQTVFIEGVDDHQADGDRPYEVLLGPAVSDDGSYDGLELGSVEVVNLDDDGAEEGGSGGK